jgi:hypothetical protein
MQETPDQEWRRLTEHYAGMWDEELLNLAADYKDLTEMAQTTLRDEMRKRGLGDPTAPQARTPVSAAPKRVDFAAVAHVEEMAPPAGPVDEREYQRCKGHYAGLSDDGLEILWAQYDDLTPSAQVALSEEISKRNLDVGEETEESSLVDDPDALARAERQVAASEERNHAEEESDEPREYSWKVLLCDCNDRTEAWQIRQALKRHGIDSWIEPERGYSMNPPQVFVAADQLEEAHRVIAQPIPQDIIDESKTEIPEFEMPECPKCGGADPVLVNAEPSNAWECAACGHQWTDAVDEAKEP